MVDQRSRWPVFVIWCTTWRTIAFALILLSFAQHNIVETSPFETFCSNKTESCGPGKVCIEYKCVCDTSNKLVYDQELDNCTRLAGSHCSPIDSDFLCVLNADCDDQTGKCTCDPGFEADLIGECRKGYSEPCHHNTEALCNAYAFLKCETSTQTCICRDASMVYDFHRSKCVAVAGSYCEFEDYLDIRRDCVPHAQCAHDPSRDESDSDLIGVCECLPGFLISDTGSCVREYEGECQVSSDCRTNFCNVTSGSCACPPDTSAFDPHTKACGLKIGEACRIDDDDDVSSRCLSNLTCDPLSNTCGSKLVDKKEMDNNSNTTTASSVSETVLADEPSPDPDSAAGVRAAVLLVASMLILVS